MKKLFEFYEARKGGFVSVLAMYSIVMTVGAFGKAGVVAGALIALACAIGKEVYDRRSGGDFSCTDIVVCMIGILAGSAVSLLCNI